jgi:predicted esterase YcpF (UPF0227 family)
MLQQFPDIMAGKKVMYVHGFGSSAQSGTVQRLREVLCQATIVAEDIPLHPQEAVDRLQQWCHEQQPDLIIGTSMGGMYAEQLYGYDRICVNAALEMGETMKAHGMTGTQQFQNPRLDGVQEFYVDKALVKEYKDQSEERFKGVTDDELHRVYGLFGDQDTTVDTYDLFHGVYPQAIHFHGEHRMNDQSFMHSVVPVIRWIDDRQEHRERPIIYIGLESLMNREQKPASSVQKAIRLLIEHYQVYFVAEDEATAKPWLEEYIGVPAWHHIVVTWRSDLLYGDYLISKQKEGDTMATLLEYGSDTFKTWEDLIDYFSHLGGQ